QLPNGSAPTGVFELRRLSDGRAVNVASIADIAGDQITVHLTDGGAGDLDSSANGEIVASIIPVRAVAPERPYNVRPLPGSASAIVTWTAPSNNGSRIDNYRLTPYLDGVAQATITLDSTRTTQTISGLTDGRTYFFKVEAHNAQGWSASSLGQNPVT